MQIVAAGQGASFVVLVKLARDEGALAVWAKGETTTRATLYAMVTNMNAST